MNILEALKQEKSKLQQRLKGVQAAIIALDDPDQTSYQNPLSSRARFSRRRTMSVAAKAKISKAAKARWAKYRADKAKKAK